MYNSHIGLSFENTGGPMKISKNFLAQDQY